MFGFLSNTFGDKSRKHYWGDRSKHKKRGREERQQRWDARDAQYKSQMDLMRQQHAEQRKAWQSRGGSPKSPPPAGAMVPKAVRAAPPPPRAARAAPLSPAPAPVITPKAMPTPAGKPTQHDFDALKARRVRAIQKLNRARSGAGFSSREAMQAAIAAANSEFSAIQREWQNMKAATGFSGLGFFSGQRPGFLSGIFSNWDRM